MNENFFKPINMMKNIRQQFLMKHSPEWRNVFYR